MLPGSDEEREAFKKADHENKLLHQNQNPGLHLTIKVTSEMRKGCDFDVFAVVTNNTQSAKKCRLVFGSCAVSYSGFMGGNCGFKDLLNVELLPGAGQPSHCGAFVWKLYTLDFWMWNKHIVCILLERRVPLRLNYSKYGSLLTEDNLIRLGALLLDYTTKESTLAVRNIALENPEIKVRVSMVNNDEQYAQRKSFNHPNAVATVCRSWVNQRWIAS